MLGLVPFKKAQSDMAVVRNLIEGRKPVPGEELLLSDDLKSLTGQCWAEAPSERPTSGTCCQTLRAAVSDEVPADDVTGQSSLDNLAENPKQSRIGAPTDVESLSLHGEYRTSDLFSDT